VDDDFYFDEATPVPAAVLALQDCGADERTPAHRRPFAGGFIFLVKCASNNENFIETLIFAEQEDGTAAHLLLFPGPGQRRAGFEELIANIRWYPATNEIGDISVDSDPESRPTPNICRSEGRWRLEGKPVTPKLVFWRETADCDGKTGWTVIVGG
jgi:hypothetical protein